MESSEEITSIVTPRVEDTILQDPGLASRVLAALRDNPKPTPDLLSGYEKQGPRFMQLYNQLGSVIANNELYLQIDISDEVIRSAGNDPYYQSKLNTLRKTGFKDDGTRVEIDQEALKLTSRANELLALARLATAKSAETEAFVDAG